MNNNYKVLLVEPNSIIGMDISSSLKLEGIEVVLAKNDAEARNKLENESFGAVITTNYIENDLEFLTDCFNKYNLPVILSSSVPKTIAAKRYGNVLMAKINSGFVEQPFDTTLISAVKNKLGINNNNIIPPVDRGLIKYA
jgi:DNA-binding NtrC family response regulator